jgi:hypothetical protein
MRPRHRQRGDDTATLPVHEIGVPLQVRINGPYRRQPSGGEDLVRLVAVLDTGHAVFLGKQPEFGKTYIRRENG